MGLMDVLALDHKNRSVAGKPVTREVGWGDASIGVESSADGTTVAVKYEHKENVGTENFKIWVIPCYLKGDLKFAIQGQVTIGEGEKTQGQVSASVSGVLELSIVGNSTKSCTAGNYVSAELTAKQSLTVTYSKAAGVEMEASTINVYGIGKVGCKLEVEHGPTFNCEAPLTNLHLFVIHLGPYVGGGFQSVRIEQGKDLRQATTGLAAFGSRIEEAVSKLGKEAKDKALESAEKGVRGLIDPGSKSPDEETAAIAKGNDAFNEMNAEFHSYLAAGGFYKELARYHDPNELSAVRDQWEAEWRSPFGGESGKWRRMADAMLARCRHKKDTDEALATVKKHNDARLQQDESDKAAELAALVKKTLAGMELARNGALGKGNDLNNNEKKTPNPKARQYFNSGWPMWMAGETARKQAAKLQGMAQVEMAQQATAQYVKARTVFAAGVAQLH